jgi:hypothetical protein
VNFINPKLAVSSVFLKKAMCWLRFIDFVYDMVYAKNPCRQLVFLIKAPSRPTAQGLFD